MSSYRRTRIAFAAAGAALIAGGLFLWRHGGLTLPWTYQGWAIPVPLHFALLGLGVLSIFFPYVLVAVAVYILPDRPKSPLNDLLTLLRHEGEEDKLPQNPTATQVADYIVQLNRRASLRLYAALFVFAILFFIALPLVITDQLSTTQFNRDADKLVDVVQDLPMDYGAADRVRSVLRETRASVESYPDTAAARLYDVLDDLYASPLTTAREFDAALSATYNKHVRPNVQTDSGAVSKVAFTAASAEVAENTRVTAAYYTILALLCNEQGNQGQFLTPYLYARQFLTAATMAMKQKPLPVTSNALGVTYSALLRRYDQYEAQFQRKRDLANSLGGPEETRPLDCVTLARAADEAFGAAVAATRNNFSLSRHLNNRTDLRLWLIHYAHVLKKPLSGNDAGEVEFLRKEVDPPNLADPSWTPKTLPTILSTLRTEVDRAFNLSPDRRILITRAQLLSLTGQLCDLYKLISPPCTSKDTLLADAINDVNVARRMGLSFRFFSADRADELFMSWMWSQPAGRAALSER